MIKFEENIDYMGWSNCLRLSNDKMELICRIGSIFINGNFSICHPAKKEKQVVKTGGYMEVTAYGWRLK